MFRKLALLAAGLVLVCAIILYAWYQVDGIPTPATEQYLSGPDFRVTTDDDGALIFTPASSNGRGIVIMHGALILPQSYAKSAAFFAAQGYTVLLPNGPGRMSIAASENTARRLQDFALKDWYFIGHSMGGMASLEMISNYGAEPRAVALWATAMPNDYSALDLPILFIWGDTDGLLPPARFRLGQQNLPAQVEYITLKGANHKNFAMYSHQFFDSEAQIDWMEQIDFANSTTAEFFARYP